MKLGMFRIILSTFFLLFGISGCTHDQTTVLNTDLPITTYETAPISVLPIDLEIIQGISEDEARTLCEETFGTVDEQTGYSYSYPLRDAFEYQGEQYYVFDMRWKMDDGRTSHLQCIMVSANGETILQGDWIWEGSTQTPQYILY